jgi:hypothetical protein
MRNQPFLMPEAQAAILALFARMGLGVGAIVLLVAGLGGGAEAFAGAPFSEGQAMTAMIATSALGIALTIYSIYRPRLAFFLAFLLVVAVLAKSAWVGLLPVWAAGLSLVWLLAARTARHREVTLS